MKYINEDIFGKGALPQEEDKRDLLFSAVAPFDWELGFDIELLLGYRAWCGSSDKFFGYRGRDGWGVERYKEIIKEIKNSKISAMAGGVEIKPYKIPVKDQGHSSSCTGQGLTYYLEVLNFIETGVWLNISARDVYAYISIGEGRGAYLRDALSLACDRGIGSEDLVPCYHESLEGHTIIKTPFTEKEYLEMPKKTKDLEKVRKMLQSLEYRSLAYVEEIDMERMAWGMMMSFGVYFAVKGQNGKNWTGEYPRIPEEVKWQHALFSGKCGIDKDGEKFVGLINSWGDDVGVSGWQKLKYDYFNGGFTYAPWVLVDKKNNNNEMTNVKIIKDKNSPAVGIWLPALSPEALESYCLNFGIEVPKKENGEIDWTSFIDGELSLNR